MIDFLQEASTYKTELSEIRKTFHRFPEIGNKEFRTSRFVEDILHSYGIQTTRATETALIGILHGSKQGKTVALRSDMDALPIQEETGCSFSSENPGMMHACGHDVHMTALVGAAKILSNHVDSLEGNVIFVFEPDEEGSGGAKRLLNTGLLDSADTIFGAHVAPDLPLGSLGFKFGKFYAASDIFNITIEGKSSHAATPELGIDATYAAAMLTCKLKALPDLLKPEKAVVTVGTLNSGTAVNILSGSAKLSGIIRTLGADSRKRIKEALKSACKEVEDVTGAKILLQLKESYPGVVNHDQYVDFAINCAESLKGSNCTKVIETPTMTTEDFGYYLEKIPGCFYHIGTGSDYPLHNSKFLPDEESFILGAAMHAQLAYSFLNAKNEV